MPIVEVLRGLFKSKDKAPLGPFVNPDELRTMAQSGRYQDVTALYESGQVAEANSDLVGYSFYQLNKYSEAIAPLKKALKVAPKDYYSNLFLSLSLNSIGQKQESVAQSLECLKLHPSHANEILNGLLPVAAELPDASERTKAFGKIAALIDKPGSSNPFLAKVLFHQRRDKELTSDVLEGAELCRFYSAKELTESGHGNYMSLGEAEKLRFVGIENSSEVLVDTITPYVAEIFDAAIMSNSSLIRVGKNKILSDVLSHKEFGIYAEMRNDPMLSARRDDAVLVKEFEPENEIAEGIMLCGHASGAYGHWFAEFLPKLRFFEKHPRFSELPLIIDEGMPQSHYDFLAALVSNPRYLLPKGGTLRVKKLFIAPADTFFPVDLVSHHKVPSERQSNSTIGGLRYMRDGIKKKFGEVANPSKRIFLSRRSSTWRRLVNEKEIISDLETLGFETVYVEDHSFAEQVQIFGNAAVIVGPNGSAFNNLIFSNPKVKVVMLGQRKLFNWGGWFGSFMELGYSLHYLPGDAVGNKDQKHIDYAVPVADVRAKVEQELRS